MVRTCPHCRLVSPPNAQRCDCGYDFAARQVVGSYLTDADREHAAAGIRASRYVVGCLLGLVGVVVGATISVWLVLQEHQRLVAESEGGEFDRHGYILLFFTLGALIGGGAIGGAAGFLFYLAATQVRRRPAP